MTEPQTIEPAPAQRRDLGVGGILQVVPDQIQHSTCVRLANLGIGLSVALCPHAPEETTAAVENDKRIAIFRDVSISFVFVWCRTNSAARANHATKAIARKASVRVQVT